MFSCVYIFVPHAYMLDPPEVGLWMFVSHHIGARTFARATSSLNAEPSVQPFNTFLKSASASVSWF